LSEDWSETGAAAFLPPDAREARAFRVLVFEYGRGFASSGGWKAAAPIFRI